MPLAAARRQVSGVSALSYLVDEALADSEERGLRMVALHVLANLLAQPLSYDPEWLRLWLLDNPLGAEGGTGRGSGNG
jgi:hypothetical protein